MALIATRVVAVDDPGLVWSDTRIPGSTPAVRLARLHHDTRTRASVSLVHFPAGWTRPGTGHYTCAEELVVLDGRIRVSEYDLDAGTHAYLPSRTARTDGAVGSAGCLAIAWFAAAPDWRPGRPAHPPDHGVHHRPLRGRRSTVHPPMHGGEAYGTEVFSLGARQWAFAPPGLEPPELPTPVLVREWP